MQRHLKKKKTFIHTVNVVFLLMKHNLARETVSVVWPLWWSRRNHRNWYILENNNVIELWSRDVTKSGIFLHVIISGMPWFLTCLHFKNLFLVCYESKWHCVKILCHYLCDHCSHTSCIIPSRTLCRILKMISFFKK